MQRTRAARSHAPPPTRIGTVRAIALRTGRGGPMREVREAQAYRNAGIEPDRWPKPHRGITLLSAPQWQQVAAELGADLPWHTRRANLLTDIPNLLPWIGQTLRIGGAVVLITGETRPCERMDAAFEGLRAALERDGRGGVHGRVLQAGRIRCGDPIERALDIEPAAT